MKEIRMIGWIKRSDDYYTHESELGTASVHELSTNKWQWEAHSSNSMQMLDMDCWWGRASSLEEAQLDVERELSRWSI
jgi:hypothetical protein